MAQIMASRSPIISLAFFCSVLFGLVFSDSNPADNPPTDFTVDVVTLFKVSLKWNDPYVELARGPIVYTIEYQAVYPESATQRGVKYHEVNDAQEAIITNGISPFTRYHFRIRKSDNEITGPYGEPIYVTTSVIGGRDAPILKPRVIKVEQTGASSSGVDVTVTFQSASARGFEHSGNLVYYSDDPTSLNYLSWPVVRVDNVEDESPLIRGLRPGTRYVFVIQNFNMRGASPVSDRTYYDVPESMPDLLIEPPEAMPPIIAPTGLTVSPGSEAGSVTVQFDPLATQNIEAYTITYTDDKGSQPSTIMIGSSLEPSFTIRHLTPGATYNFTVKARNRYGEGRDSNTVTFFVPLENEPMGSISCPNMERYRSCLDECYMVSDCPRGKICCYNGCGRNCVDPVNNQESKPIHEASCPQLQSPAHGSVRCSSGNKIYSVCYYICDPGYLVEGSHSRTCSGEQQWSGSDAVCTPVSGREPPKSPPSDLSVTQYDSTTASLSLSWTPSEDYVSAYVVYYASASGLSQDVWTSIEVLGDQATCSLTNVTPNSVYYIKILAKNTFGQSPMSSLVVYNTGESTSQTCPALSPPENGEVRCEGDNRVGATCHFTCNERFSSDDALVIRCTADTRWDGPIPECVQSEETIYAGCYILPNPAMNPRMQNYRPIQGRISITQKVSEERIDVTLSLNGFDSNSTHGFHVHQYGFIDTRQGCSAAGGHYNPLGKVHGAPNDEERHVGDLGNIQSDEYGRVQLTMSDNVASLVGVNSIIGRAFVIHAGIDDLGRGGNEGSLATGNAGARLACCTIGRLPKPE